MIIRSLVMAITGRFVSYSLLAQAPDAQNDPKRHCRDRFALQVGPSRGSLRLRFEDWDFFKAQVGDSRYGYGASLLRLSLGKQQRSQDWLFELAQPSLIGLPSQAIAPVPQGQLGFLAGTYFAANPDHAVGILLKQAFVRLKGIGRDQASNLRIGRFEFGDGLELTPESPMGALVRDRVANRLIGNFGFTHVGRSLDGIHFSRGASSTNFTFAAGRPTEGVFQVKGMKDLNVDLIYAAWNQHHPVARRRRRTVVRDVLPRWPRCSHNRPLPLRSEDRKASALPQSVVTTSTYLMRVPAKPMYCSGERCKPEVVEHSITVQMRSR